MKSNKAFEQNGQHPVSTSGSADKQKTEAKSQTAQSPEKKSKDDSNENKEINDKGATEIHSKVTKVGNTWNKKNNN